MTPTLRNLSGIPREIVTTQVCHHMVSGWDRAVQVMNYCIHDERDEHAYLQTIVVDSVCVFMHVSK